MTRSKMPEIINLPAGKLDEIKTQLAASSILEEDTRKFNVVFSHKDLLLDNEWLMSAGNVSRKI